MLIAAQLPRAFLLPAEQNSGRFEGGIMLRVNSDVGKGKRGTCPNSSGFVGEFAALQAGRFVQAFVCLFLPPLALQDLRAVLEELSQESDFAPTGPILNP